MMTYLSRHTHTEMCVCVCVLELAFRLRAKVELKGFNLEKVTTVEENYTSCVMYHKQIF